MCASVNGVCSCSNLIVGYQAGVSRCAVPHKPEAFTNLVNSIRWAAMAPKIQKPGAQSVVVHASEGNATATEQNLQPANAQRKLHDAPAEDVSGNGGMLGSSSSPQEWTGGEELMPLMEPQDAYRTVITVAALFGIIVAAHAGVLQKLLTQLLLL
jgi:hypothetical protein